MIFSDRGRAYWLKVHEIPDVGPAATRQGDRQPGVDGGRREDRRAARRAGVPDETTTFIVMGTRKGVVKKTDLRAFSNPRAGGIIAMGVEDDDAVIAVQVTDGSSEMLHRHARTAWRSASRRPTCGRWAAPPTASAASRCAKATRSWRWRCVKPGGTVLTVTEQGYGKRTELDEYRLQSRGGYRHHQHPDQRPQRQGGRHRLRHRRATS